MNKYENGNSQLRTTTFQKMWLSPSGIGGSERGVDRITTQTANLGIPSTVLTCGEYYRGVQRPPNYSFLSFPEQDEGKKVISVPTVEEIADYICCQKPNKLGILQMVWGFEHYPKSLIQCLNIKGLPKIFVTMEVHQFSQLTQELESHQEKINHVGSMRENIDVLVAISTPLLQEAKQLKFPDVRLIYLPVDTTLFCPIEKQEKNELREQMNISTEKNIALFVGRIVEEKGVRFIMDAFRELRKAKDKNWQLIIAGGIKEGDELRDEFFAFINEFSDRVKYLGVLTDEKEVAKIMRISDVFLYPTKHQEGLGLSVAEAMSCGLPVITTQFAAVETGMIDLVKKDETAMIFEEKNGGIDLANILKTTSVEGLQRMGKLARQRIFDLKMDSVSVALQWRQLLFEVQKKYSKKTA